MSQTTFDDDDLFGEAADEVREDVERALGEARSSLPDPDDVWETDGDNVLGVLNGLRSSMDPGDAEDHLRDAKKWYTMGERAGAFEDAEDLAADIEVVEEVVADMADAREQVSDVAGTIPELRSALEEARSDDGGEESGSDDESATADEEAATDGGTPDGEPDEETGEEARGGEEQATLDGDDD